MPHSKFFALKTTLKMSIDLAKINNKRQIKSIPVHQFFINTIIAEKKLSNTRGTKASAHHKMNENVTFAIHFKNNNASAIVHSEKQRET